MSTLHPDTVSQFQIPGGQEGAEPLRSAEQFVFTPRQPEQQMPPQEAVPYEQPEFEREQAIHAGRQDVDRALNAESVVPETPVMSPEEAAQHVREATMRADAISDALEKMQIEALRREAQMSAGDRSNLTLAA